jgi:hypothetical protein
VANEQRRVVNVAACSHENRKRDCPSNLPSRHQQILERALAWHGSKRRTSHLA